jgi:hypothetical protein
LKASISTGILLKILATCASAQEISYTGSVSYLSGQYGLETTTRTFVIINELENPIRLRVEVVRRLGPRWRGAVAVDGSTEIVNGSGSSVMLEASALRSVSRKAETGVHLAIGLTNGAPDVVASFE